MFKWFRFVTKVYLLFINCNSKVINGCIRFHKLFYGGSYVNVDEKCFYILCK